MGHRVLTSTEATQALAEQLRNLADDIDKLCLEGNEGFRGGYHYVVVNGIKHMIAKAEMIEERIEREEREKN